MSPQDERNIMSAMSLAREHAVAKRWVDCLIWLNVVMRYIFTSMRE